MKFKVGDRIIVQHCPRGGTELGLVGIVVDKNFDGRVRQEGTVWVLIDMMSSPFTFREEDIRLLTPLDQLL